MDSSAYTRLPQIDRLLRTPEVAILLAEYARARVAAALRQAIERARDSIREGGDAFDFEECIAFARSLLAAGSRPGFRRVVNATGIVLNTNLGRAPLARAALDAVVEISAGYSNLEYDLESGGRGSRAAHVAPLLERLTGAESAAVVNNNAAAVLLALTALAHGREVVVSRGQLVEIGGAFRIPEIVESGGARLVEVGTTNRTRLDDYRRAVTDRTALFLKVHTSNYRITGFVESVSSLDLARLGREARIPVMEDLGSGALVDLPAAGGETTVRATLEAGVDLVTFSGDKLLGGPQAGILAGRRDLIETVRRHPMARAMRCDKMTLAALEATLRLYDSERAWDEIPALRYLGRTRESIDEIAIRLCAHVPAPLRGECIPGFSQVGGGSLPEERLPTVLVALDAPGLSDDDLARRLRAADPAVIARTQHGQVLLDPRTLEEDDLRWIVAALESIAGAMTHGSPSRPGESEKMPAENSGRRRAM